MPDIETKLRGYIEKTMNDEKFGKQIRREWAFGAMDFAFSVSLIDWTTYSELMDEYFD